MLAGVGLFKLVQSDSDPTEVSSPPKTALNAIPLTTLEGLESTLEDWRGEILVVNFWAPWCLPCRREIPTLIELQATHAEDQVKVLGIALDGYQSVKDFAQEHQINYPLFLVGNRTSMYNAVFENPSGSLPFTAILDRDLQIRFKHNGEVSAEQLAQQLAPLLR